MNHSPASVRVSTVSNRGFDLLTEAIKKGNVVAEKKDSFSMCVLDKKRRVSHLIHVAANRERV